MSDRLDLFVREALAKGVERETVRKTLLAARWPEDEVAAALDAYAEVDFPIPVPRPKVYGSAKDAFGYLVLFTTLYTSAVALVRLVYEFINRAFPDPGETYYFWERSAETMRWSSAALIIAFPVFLVLSRRVYRQTRRDPEKRTSKIRKWLTYLTLFVAAAVLLCDGIALVYYLLGGELTVRFILKAVTIATVAGGVFGYYLWDLRQGDAKPEELERRHPGVRALAAILVVAVAAALAASFATLDAPALVRLQNLDAERLGHLRDIAASIDAYWNLRRELPSDLEALAMDRNAAPRSIHDPLTGALYDYAPGEEGAYELCAGFELEDLRPQLRGVERFWGHPAGRHCFQIRVEDWPDGD